MSSVYAELIHAFKFYFYPFFKEPLIGPLRRMRLYQQPQPQLLPLPQKILESVPFFHILYNRAISIGVQLPLKISLSPLPLQLAARSNKISIQRQLLLPQHCEKMFINSSCKFAAKRYVNLESALQFPYIK